MKKLIPLLLIVAACSTRAPIQLTEVQSPVKASQNKINRGIASTATQGLGVCAVASIGVAGFTPSSNVGSMVSGPGYAGYTILDTTNLQATKAACSDEYMAQVMVAYCQANPGAEPQQWGVATYDVNGNWQSSTCAASGCDYHPCPELPPVEFVVHTNKCQERREYNLCHTANTPWDHPDAEEKLSGCLASYYQNHSACEDYFGCKEDAQTAFTEAKQQCKTLPQAQRPACNDAALAQKTSALTACESLNPQANYQYNIPQ